MPRKRNPEALCVCLEDFVHVIPASVLEIRKTGPESNVDSVIETPEKRIQYTRGQVVSLCSKAARRNFMKFHLGKFRLPLENENA